MIATALNSSSSNSFLSGSSSSPSSLFFDPVNQRTMMPPALDDNSDEHNIPDEFLCPLSLEIMKDPVMSRYGNSFERDAILQWLGRGHTTCPLSRRPLKLSDLITNHQLRGKIRRWQVENDVEITVFMEDKPCEIFGFINVPERDPDMTERPHDDHEFIIEFPRLVDSGGAVGTIRRRDVLRSTRHHPRTSSSRRPSTNTTATSNNTSSNNGNSPRRSNRWTGLFRQQGQTVTAA